MLARDQPRKEDAKRALFWLSLVVWALVLGAAFILLALSLDVSRPVDLVGLVASYMHDLSSYLHDPTQAPSDKVLRPFVVLFAYGVLIFPLANLTTYILLKLRPPPGAASSPGH